MKARVLFVCVENSCRSQIAEGFARKLGRDVLEAWSAGSKPSGKVNETAVRLMKERGIELSHQLSKGLSDLPKVRWDYVVTMGCGDACPFVPAQAKLDWNIADPKALPDDEFRKVIGLIEERVVELIHNVIRKAA
jgi:protein-tyrosine-phosphatase